MKISLIKPYEKNAKKHPARQVAQIANSIKEFGFNQPVVIDKDNVIIIGHGRFLAAQELGMKDIPVLKVDLDKKKAAAYRLADNKLNESDWDMRLVIDELKLLSDELIDLTGFDKDLVITGDEADDVIPVEPKKPQTKQGDLYELGTHRIVCGDSTKTIDLALLFGKEKAKLCFTSPPYNMANSKLYDKYKDNRASQEYVDFNVRVIKELEPFIKGFLFWNISYNKNSRKEWIEVYYNVMKQTKFRFLESIVWDKGHGLPVNSKDALTRQYESVVSFDEPAVEKEIDRVYLGANGPVVFNKKTQRKLTNYWYIPTMGTQNVLNQAAFPVALPTKAIMTMTNEKDIVFDPFMGVGSTMIAAEKANRRAFGIELSEGQVDVIVQRYVDFTNNESIIKNGKKITWQKTQ